MAVNVLGSPHKMPHLHDLPDLVIDKILGFLPTKAAVQATFLSKQSPVSSASALNFDETDDFRRHNPNGRFANLRQHSKFINFLKGYLEYHKKYEKKEVLDSLRLDMLFYFCRDATVIDRWLERAINRGLKELDISPRQISIIHGEIVVEAEKLYRLPWVYFANNAQSLTSLNLEYVRMADIQSAKLQRDEKYLLPSLKTMSLECVWFDDKAFFSLLLECPSIKYLSLTECTFGDFTCRVSSSSLEFLKLKFCFQLQVLQVHDETKNLESFTFFSESAPYSLCENVILNKSFKLRNINIFTRSYNLYDSYHLSWVTLFANAKFLTCLNLEDTRIANISANVQSDERLLPSLKTLSFAISWFADKALSSLLLECPSIEYLSITKCCFENFQCQVSSLNLKSLEVMDCERLQVLQVDEAKNLESFTFASPLPSHSKCEKVILNNTFNLKNINICVDDLGQFSLNGYHRTLKATIDVQNLHLFDFLGTLKDAFSVKGCQWAKIAEREGEGEGEGDGASSSEKASGETVTSPRLQWAKIAVRELWFKNWFVHYSSHFPTLIGCLKEFGCYKKISLYNQDLKALIIPNFFRKEFSSPLPKICTLEVRMPNPPTEASRDYFDLMDSLHWIAPSAEVEICRSETHCIDALLGEY